MNIVCVLIEVPSGYRVEVEDLTCDGRQHARFMAEKLIEELEELDCAANKAEREA